MLKIRRSRDRLIFNMVIPILVRWHLYIETVPRFLYVRSSGQWKEWLTVESGMHRYYFYWNYVKCHQGNYLDKCHILLTYLKGVQDAPVCIINVCVTNGKGHQWPFSFKVFHVTIYVINLPMCCHQDNKLIFHSLRGCHETVACIWYLYRQT